MRPIFAAIASRARASVWVRPALKLALVFVGLIVLAGIGRTVTATAAVGWLVPPSAASAAASSFASTDAGAFEGDASPRASPSASAAASAVPASAAPTVHAARATADDPVFLNSATGDDLRRLPGVGEKRAQAILELRAKLGHFRQIEELMRVKGIGRATLRKLRPLVRLDRPDGGV
ncbi:hypothetical protein BH09MYX1_BH09MYX1_04030 [soil metagenome]